MSSRKLDVDVRRNGRLVERVTARPVRLLPDGRAGIVFGGAVFPLYPNNTVDLDDNAVDKDLCPRFVKPTESICYATRTTTSARGKKLLLSKWYVEENRYGFYLVFDASEAKAQRVADRMVETGLGVRRWDASFRPASDGYQYDWFIRLEADGPDTPERVCAALGLEAAPHEAATVRSTDRSEEDHQQFLLGRELENLSTKLELLDARAAELKALADALTAENQELITALARSNDEVRRAKGTLRKKTAEVRRAEAARDRAVTERDSLQRKLEAAPAASDGQVDGQLEELRAENQVLFKEWESAELRADSAAIKLDQVLGQLEHSAHRVEQLEDEVAKLRETSESQRELTRAAASTRGGLDHFLAKLLPRTTLHPDAVDALSALEKPDKILEALVHLDRFERGRGGDVPAHPLDSYKPWHQVDSHLATGSSGSTSGGGRIYFARQRSRLFVMVQHKTDGRSQDQTYRRLKGWQPWDD